jgi:hypothetical protein
MFTKNSFLSEVSGILSRSLIQPTPCNFGLSEKEDTVLCTMFDILDLKVDAVIPSFLL